MNILILKCTLPLDYKNTDAPKTRVNSKLNNKDAKGCPFKNAKSGFPGGAVVENLPANAGDTGSSPGLGRSHMLQSN